jgi:hypothetical protein
LAAQLLKRLFPKERENPFTENLQETEFFEKEKVLWMQEKLNLILKNAEAPSLESEDFSKLKQAFLLFLNTGYRTSNLEKLYNALCTVKPSSTDNEGAFSVSSNFAACR